MIGGDDHYTNEDEKERTVISRWARRKVASQFSEEYLDGRKSFIFSWNKKHREIHEEALLHYFDPSKKGQKFEYQPKPKPAPPLPKPDEPKEVFYIIRPTYNSPPHSFLVLSSMTLLSVNCRRLVNRAPAWCS